MHVLPRVAELHERFGGELVVIGIHAGKYPAERRTDKIRLACARLGVHHPVVNDRQFRIWRSFDVEAWPTVAIVSPDGRLAGVQAGEFEVGEMARAIDALAEPYRRDKALETTPLAFGVDPLAPPEPAGPVSFPGKVAWHDGTLYVSDTGHARVLEVALTENAEKAPTGAVLRVFGASESDAVSPREVGFVEPQGLAVADGALWVADRGAHQVKRVDLASGQVSVAAGEGGLADRGIAEGPGDRTRLRSPWDVRTSGGGLAIAMAGSHQLWRLDTRSGDLSILAGSGLEAIVDGPARSAKLAQPMGLAGGDVARWFTDAESSSVRVVGGDGTVRSLVGTGLFDHGDRDGVGERALLQHPEALTELRGELFVCDTYNDKLKVLDPSSRRCTAMTGDAGSGHAFSHPAGVTTDGTRLFVADTEAHRVAVVDPETGAVATLVIEEREMSDRLPSR